MIGFSIRAERTESLEDDSTPQVRGNVIENDHVHIPYAEAVRQLSRQADTNLESRTQVEGPGQENAHIDVAFAMRPILGMASESIRRDDSRNSQLSQRDREYGLHIPCGRRLVGAERHGEQASTHER